MAYYSPKLRTYPSESFGGGVGQNFKPSRGTYDCPINKVAIFGHSYVHRLFIEKPVIHPGIAFRKFSLPGARVDNIRNHHIFADLVNYQPDLTFLVIGGNDINSNTVPRDLAHAIQDLCQDIETQAGGRCIIIGIEKRTNPRNISEADYRRVKNAVNRWLHRQLPYAKRRFEPMAMTTEDLAWDGVHMTPAGSEKLFERLVTITLAHFDA